jgi:competence protein ComEA
MLTAKEYAILGGAAAVLCVGTAGLWLAGGSGAEEAELVVIPNEGASPTQEDKTVHAPPPPTGIVVAVAGAVRQPGVYTMQQNARVEDLLQEAGGPLTASDLSDINRAAPLLDGTTLTIPERRPASDGGQDEPCPNPPQYRISTWQTGAPRAAAVSTSASGGPATAAPSHAGQRLNVNTATQAQLETLPGIGPVLAQAIIRYRSRKRFSRPEELTEVPNIGPKRFEAIRPFVAVR